MNSKNVILGAAFAVASAGIMVNQTFGELEQIEITSEASLRAVLKKPHGPCSVAVSAEARVKVDDLVNVLQGLTQIEELNLRRCMFYIEGAKKISEWLRKNQSLRKLDLAFNDIENEGAKALAEALKENRTLKTLIVNGNFIHDAGASALRDALKDKNTTLQELDLGGSINNVSESIVQEIESCLKRNRDVASLMQKLSISESDPRNMTIRNQEDEKPENLNASLLSNTTGGSQNLNISLPRNMTVRKSENLNASLPGNMTENYYDDSDNDDDSDDEMN